MIVPICMDAKVLIVKASRVRTCVDDFDKLSITRLNKANPATT